MTGSPESIVSRFGNSDRCGILAWPTLPDFQPTPVFNNNSPSGLFFEHRRVFHFHRLRDEHDGLVHQFGQVAVGEGELADRGHDGLLERAIEHLSLGFLAFLDPLLQLFRHRVEGLG